MHNKKRWISLSLLAHKARRRSVKPLGLINEVIISGQTSLSLRLGLGLVSSPNETAMEKRQPVKTE